MNSDMEKRILKLLLAVRVGDDDACAELIRIYSPLISGLVRSTVSHLPPYAQTDEDELLQEAAIKLYQAALSYDLHGSMSFGLYAKICIRNRMISLLRRHAGDAGVQTVELSEEIAVPEEEEDPSETLLRAERERELDERIKGILSPLEYEVYSMYIDGSRTGEIAQKLSVGNKTVENAVYRMKAKLGKLFL